MAIEEDVLLSCSSPMSPLPAGCGCLSLANIDPLFARKDWKWTDHGPVEDFEYPQNAWTNYFLAALDGSLKTMDTEGAVRRRAVNCQMMVDGNVPHGAGLSSSAALVVASALALWHVDSQRSPEIRKLDFVGEVMVYERAVGVNSGG